MAVTLIRKTANTKYKENELVFRVDPKYNKKDIKEYLTKLYGLDILRINTQNYDGKVKRAEYGHRIYKEKAYKKAVVTVKLPQKEAQ